MSSRIEWVDLRVRRSKEDFEQSALNPRSRIQSFLTVFKFYVPFHVRQPRPFHPIVRRDYSLMNNLKIVDPVYSLHGLACQHEAVQNIPKKWFWYRIILWVRTGVFSRGWVEFTAKLGKFHSSEDQNKTY